MLISDIVLAALIAAMPGLLALVVGRRQSRDLRRDVRDVHILVNSQKDALTGLLQQALVEITGLKQSNAEKDRLLATQATELASRSARHVQQQEHRS